MYNYIDLFAGAGGLSEGFQREGFSPLLHIEMDKPACNTLKTRTAYYFLLENNMISIYKDYLSQKISQEQFYSYIPKKELNKVYNETLSNDTMSKVKEEIKNRLPSGGLDILVGGPPCQTYSLVGRSVQKDKIHNDERNYLFNLYVDILEEFKPKIFIFENVTGLLSAKNIDGILYIDLITEAFDKAGYKIEKRVLNARQFGVLQNRKRVIIIGWKKGTNFSYPNFNSTISDDFLVGDLFEDLPGINENIYRTDEISKYLEDYKIREEKDNLTQHYTRTINSRDQKIYHHAISIWEKDKKRLSYTDLPSELTTHKNTTSFLDRFKVVASDLHYSQTILAHLSKDGHYYIYPDKKQCRSVSIREAARLQSFPDNYFFEGTMTQAFKQIGNAVPPLMSAEIAKSIKEQLNGAI